MIEIFKTDVSDLHSAGQIIQKLYDLFPHCRINFDLSDDDNILRVEGHHFPIEDIREFVMKEGHFCELLS